MTDLDRKYDSLQQENQKLSDDNKRIRNQLTELDFKKDDLVNKNIELTINNKQLKEELDKLQQSHDNYTKEVFNQHMKIQQLQQDSKTNAEIVEKIKNRIDYHKSYLKPESSEIIINELQAILKETK